MGIKSKIFFVPRLSSLRTHIMKFFAALLAAVLVMDMVACLDMDEEEKPSFIPIPVLTIINMAIKVLKGFVCKVELIEIEERGMGDIVQKFIDFAKTVLCGM